MGMKGEEEEAWFQSSGKRLKYARGEEREEEEEEEEEEEVEEGERERVSFR
ncbi:hypothetical protein CsSME_00043122 [Camellia sinensis var. sinensis]